MKDFSECRLLITDDVKANVDVLVEALRDEYKLSVALSGEAALRSAEKNPPDLVLLDVMMPGMDGYEVCRRLRASAKTQDVPVMFLSALGEVQNKTHGFEAGGNDYLTKPFEMLEVKARVRSLLKAKAYTDAVKEQIASELRIARQIQRGILPADVSEQARGTGLDVHAVLVPAKAVGGDLYDVVRTDDGRVLVVVGDVSGKGVPAALFMAVTTTLIRCMARQYKNPEDLVRQVSDALTAQNPQNMFVTLFCAVFEAGKSEFTYVNAGHPSPVLLRPGSAPSLSLDSTAMMAGIFPDMAVQSGKQELRPGDMLIFYSDGVTEAFNAKGELFGERRLIEHLSRDPGTTPAEVVAGLLTAVQRHAGEEPQSDDIAIVGVRAM